ncbi:MAG: hypothetical protein AB8H03_20010 [Saprospiraceae bacterium]
MENILDEYSKKTLSKELYESVKWWEKRRIYFNIIVSLAWISPFFFSWESLGNINVFGLLIAFCTYVCFANLCFCFSWVIDILKSYYFENPKYGSSKTYLFVLGMIFSILITLFFSSYFLIII